MYQTNKLILISGNACFFLMLCNVFFLTVKTRFSYAFPKEFPFRMNHVSQTSVLGAQELWHTDLAWKGSVTPNSWIVCPSLKRVSAESIIPLRFWKYDRSTRYTSCKRLMCVMETLEKGLSLCVCVHRFTSSMSPGFWHSNRSDIPHAPDTFRGRSRHPGKWLGSYGVSVISAVWLSAGLFVVCSSGQAM